MKTLSAIALSICLGTLALGCDHAAPAEENLETATLALIEGSPEAIGLLEFLNDPTTTVDVLDYDVPLNRRAARNIIHHRDGYDGLAGTYDDNLFDHISEVDAVRWVGKSAMASLTYFAHTQSWVPMGSDVLGTYDGVLFTADEAELTLAFANAANEEMLDDTLALDRRAASAIVTAQPIATLSDLADLYFVGNSALNILKEAAIEAAVPSLDTQFTEDLKRHLEEWYGLYGAQALDSGARELIDAQAALSIDMVELIEDAKNNPFDLSLESAIVLAHPEVIFAASEIMWFAAYDKESGALIELARF